MNTTGDWASCGAAGSSGMPAARSGALRRRPARLALSIARVSVVTRDEPGELHLRRSTSVADLPTGVLVLGDPCEALDGSIPRIDQEMLVESTVVVGMGLTAAVTSSSTFCASRRAISASPFGDPSANVRLPGNGTFLESFKILLSGAIDCSDSGAFHAS